MKAINIYVALASTGIVRVKGNAIPIRLNFFAVADAQYEAGKSLLTCPTSTYNGTCHE